MKIVFHKGLTLQSWFSKNLCEQMANVGSEVFRMIKWQSRDLKDSELAFERALELIDMTMADPKNKKSLKEIVRVREVLADYFYDNEYQTTAQFWQNYFYGFNYAARNF